MSGLEAKESNAFRVGLGRICWAGPSPRTQGSLEGARQSMGAPSKLHWKQQLGTGDQSGRKERLWSCWYVGAGKGKREGGAGEGTGSGEPWQTLPVSWQG